jgi:hypothetical protein
MAAFDSETGACSGAENCAVAWLLVPFGGVYGFALLLGSCPKRAACDSNSKWIQFELDAH